MTTRPPARASSAGPQSRRLTSRLARPPACHHWANLPTPVQRAPWLDGGGVECWIKRDDLSSPIYGGGKVRKLEWLLATPPFDGPEPLVSMGGIGSHHLLALALFLARQDRALHALVFDQVLTSHARTNLAALASLGTEFWSSRTRAGLGWSGLAYRTWAKPGQGGIPVEAGASSPLGSLGFVEAGLELAAQIEAKLIPRPARIYITAGSAGSSAGLALGLALAGCGTHLRLVSAVEIPIFNRILFRHKLRVVYAELRRRSIDSDGATSAAHLLHRSCVRWSIDHSQVGRGYAVPTDESRAALIRARDYGIGLENTYTGKCVAAIQWDLQHGRLTRGSSILFWNTHAGTDLSPHIRDDWEASLPPALRRRIERGQP